MHTVSSGGLRHHPYCPRICRAFPTLRLGPAPPGLNSEQRRQLLIVAVNVIEHIMVSRHFVDAIGAMASERVGRLMR